MELVVEPKAVASVVAELPGVARAFPERASAGYIAQAWGMETGLTLEKEAEQHNRKAADRSVLLCDDACASMLVSESYLGMRCHARKMAYLCGTH